MSKNILRSAAILAGALAAGLGAEVIMRDLRHELPPEDPRVVKARTGLITHKYPNRKSKRKFFAERKRAASRALNQRLAPATGPGSINVESEMLQLIRANAPKAAYELYKAHHQVVCLGHGQPCSKLKPWTHRWAAEFKRAA